MSACRSSSPKLFEYWPAKRATLRYAKTTRLEMTRRRFMRGMRREQKEQLPV